MMKTIFTNFLILITIGSVFSQNVTNVESKQVGNNAEITYYLDKQANIEVRVSEDGGNFYKSIHKVSGDVGRNQTAGYKKIVWDVLAERDKLQGENIVFKVSAIIPTYDVSSKVVVIDGIKWATCNVNAPGTFTNKPEQSGLFYQWGSDVGWSSSDPLTADGYNTWRDLSEKVNAWQTSKDPCPPGWRIPTKAELESLTNTEKVTSALTNVNGISGYRIKDKTTGSSIFLPAAGCRGYYGGSLYYVNSGGYYWSNTPVGGFAQYLRFYNGGFDMSRSNRADGYSVRCVTE